MVDGALLLTMMAVSGVMVIIILFGGRKPRGRPAATQGRAPTFDPGDLTELTRRFKVVDQQHRHDRLAKSNELHRRLDALIRDRAPVRSIAPGPDPERAHIRFADGTTLRVRVNREQLAPLSETIDRSAVWLSAYRLGPPGLRLTFDSRSGRVTMLQLGVDIH